MISLFRDIFPYLLVLYFVIKGIKEPFFFLGIPFLMFMSESIFFEGVKIFKIPGSLSYGLMFFWLILLRFVAVFLARSDEKKDYSYMGRFNAMDFCIIGLLLISVIGAGTTLINYADVTDVIKEFIVLISLFVSYFIIKNWTSRTNPEVLVNFLFSIVVINTLTACLYILHQGLHFGIYPDAEYSVDIVQGVAITRTFYFMPQFLPLSVAFLLIFRHKKPFVFHILLIINVLAIFISYTRSFLINAMLIFILYFIITGLKEGRIGLVLKNILVFGFIGILGLFVLSKFLPANTQFFLNRFSELKQSSATSDPNNIQFRFQMTGLIVASMDEDKKIFGMGPVTENQVSWVRDMRATTADMVWTGVIFRWGIVGLILFILLYIFSGYSALNFYLNSEGVLSDLGLLFLLYIFSQIIESFVSWTFMSGHGFATGLWYLGMLSAFSGITKNKESLVKEVIL
jgi:hypothetical protein